MKSIILQLCERSELCLFFRLLFDCFWPFYAVKTMLSKLENLRYLRSKKVNFNAQHWLHCIKMVKNIRSIGEKINWFVQYLSWRRFLASKVLWWQFSIFLGTVPRSHHDTNLLILLFYWCLIWSYKSHWLLEPSPEPFISIVFAPHVITKVEGEVIVA